MSCSDYAGQWWKTTQTQGSSTYEGPFIPFCIYLCWRCFIHPWSTPGAHPPPDLCPAPRAIHPRSCRPPMVSNHQGRHEGQGIKDIGTRARCPVDALDVFVYMLDSAEQRTRPIPMRARPLVFTHPSNPCLPVRFGQVYNITHVLTANDLFEACNDYSPLHECPDDVGFNTAHYSTLPSSVLLAPPRHHGRSASAPTPLHTRPSKCPMSTTWPHHARHRRLLYHNQPPSITNRHRGFIGIIPNESLYSLENGTELGFWSGLLVGKLHFCTGKLQCRDVVLLDELWTRCWTSDFGGSIAATYEMLEQLYTHSSVLLLDVISYYGLQ